MSSQPTPWPAEVARCDEREGPTGAAPTALTQGWKDGTFAQAGFSSGCNDSRRGKMRDGFHRPRGVEAPCGAAPPRWSSVGTGRTSSVAGERARAQHSPLQLTHFWCHSCRGRDEPDQRGCGGGGGGGSYGGGPRDDGPGKRRRGGGAELEPGELEPGEIDYEPRGPRGVSSAVPLGGCPPCALLSRTSATARQGPKEWGRRCAKAAGRHRQTAVEAGPGVHRVPEATSNGGRR